MLKARFMKQYLVINLFLNDDFYPVIRFEKIIDTKFYICHEILSTENFNEALGGLEILIDNHKAIFRTNEFHDLMEPFYFLIESLAILNVFNSDYFSKFKMSNDSICRKKIENDQELILEPVQNEDIVLFSFISTNPEPNKSRNNPYFVDFKINKDEWIEQCVLAINEFLFVAKNNDELKNDEFWNELMYEWEKGITK